jgi:dimethylamine monooxygenase subunit A
MTPSALSAELLRSYAPDPAPYWPAGETSWLDEVDLTVTDAHARMGTRALPEDRWLLRDHLAPDELLLRRRLLAEQRAHVFACSPQAEQPAREVDHLVDRWLATHVEGSALSPESEAEHPLARAGGRVQEDLCLMVRHDDAWRLEGAVLCFPSLLLLSEKLGLPTALVHQPVPYYAEELSQKVDTMFDRFPVGKVVWRRNVSVWPALVLWAPCHRLDPSLYADVSPQDGVPPLWIRSERQTLRRLPDTGAILFTIRVQSVPIAVLAHRPDRARDLAAWFRAPIGAVRRGQLGTHLEPMLDWLDGVSATG